jgi:hydrogenase maturation protease
VTTPLAPLAVVGIGNVLRSDDGVGVRVIEGLRALVDGDVDGTRLPVGTQLVDGGTLGLDILRIVRDVRGIVIVDAVCLGAPAGTVTVHDEPAIEAAAASDGGRIAGAVGELLSIGRLMGWLPEPVVLVGIEVEDLGLGIGLTPDVARAVPVAISAVQVELARMNGLPVSGGEGGASTRALAGATA